MGGSFNNQAAFRVQRALVVMVFHRQTQLLQLAWCSDIHAVWLFGDRHKMGRLCKSMQCRAPKSETNDKMSQTLHSS